MPEALPKNIITLLGFDFGLKKIGVAVGKTVTGIASPLQRLDARDGAPQWGSIQQLIAEWQPQLLVVGYPLHMDGSEQEITKAAKRFGNRLAGRFQLPVVWVDERLSSYEAEQYLFGSKKNAQNDKLNLDSISAKLIIEQWLNEYLK
ncbi:MAG TPA: Holliday junction resolvase RuvX [Gammaproteobacteria bacterium]|nr:Holliday junction resolvase RuvX [Gammaproteobacteria bacterium]